MLARSAHAKNRTNRIIATPIIRLYFTPGDSRRRRAAPLLHVPHVRPLGGPALAGAGYGSRQTHPGPGTQYAQRTMLIPRGARAVSAGTVTDIPLRPEHAAGG